MTDQTTTSAPAATAPAGWYPDPHGAPTLRWWNGVSWSDNYAPMQHANPVRPAISAETPVSTPWIWLVVFLPILSYVPLFFITPAQFLPYSTDPYAFTGTVRSILTWDVISFGFSTLVWGASVLFAWLDYRELTRRGVQRPFHWAWAFLAALVYIIGRTVIVKQVSGRGMGPIWGYVGMFVASMVIGFVWVFYFMWTLSGTFGEYVPSYYS